MSDDEVMLEEMEKALIPALPPSRREKKGDACRKGKMYGPCRVCGLLKPDMPANSPYCWEHKSSADALVSKTKADDKKRNPPSDAGMQIYKKAVADSKDQDPPNDLSKLVLEFEKISPPTSKGVKRNACDTIALMQRFKKTEQMRQEFRAVIMHWEQWQNHASKVLMLPAADVLSRWEKAKRETPKHLQDNKGPSNSALRLPMHVEDAFVGASISEFSTETELSGKRRKIRDGEDVDQTVEESASSSVGFSHASFAAVGGDLAEAVARSGSSSFQASASGCVFGAQLRSGEAPEVTGVQVIVSPQKKEPEKKDKWDVLTGRLKVQRFIEDKEASIRKKCSLCVLACKDAFEKTNSRSADVPNQTTYIQIMAQRQEIVMAIMVETLS